MKNMSTEQKELLLQIVDVKISNFNNDMIDHWKPENFRLSDFYNQSICRLESQYKELYGDLPEWKYIDDVVACRDSLRKELNR